MRRKEKDKDKQTKPQRRWGVGKTLAVVFASVAFIVGVAILGVYLADGFREHTTIPQDISFNEQNDPNYNADLNRLEITNNYNLTIGSTTGNVTSDVVTLGFSRTYAYNFETKSFTDEGWGTTQTGDYIDNGVIRIPRQVRIGVPFTVEVLTYDYNYEINGEKKQADQIRGGISTIEAQSQNPDLTPISLTIAVDSPVQETKVVLLDAHGNEITPSGDISEVVEEEIFNVITKFYPEESRYCYADTARTKTSFYQPSNVSSEVANVVYDSSTSLHFEAGLSAEGGTITAFTAVNAKVQEQVEEDVLDMGLTDNASIYNAYVNYYSKLAGEQVLTEQVEFNVVQANVDEFNVGSKGQTFDIHDLADLRIFLGDNAKAPDKCLGVQVISQNGASLNNILANVALSFSLKDQDPTIAQEGSSPILAIKGGDGQKLTPTVLDGVNYYFPYINEGVTDYKNAFWDLRVSEGYQNSEITVKVSLLLENEEDGYQLFELQEEFSLAVIKHEESDVSWAEGTDLTQELLLTYAEGSESPKPTTFSLAGLTDVPADNIFKTVAYFVGFDDSLLGEGDDSAKTASAITLARQIFDGLVDSSRAGVYQTATGDKILVPLIITGDTLTVQEVGQFNLYFASVNGTAESGLYNVVKMVEEPITITVTKTLYINSVSGAQVLIDSALNEGGFTEVTESVFVPTISDNADKDQIQLVFTIALDSATVFEEEFQNGRISLEIYSNENIINSNFTISNGQFAISEEDQTATLTYTLTANSSFTVANDTPITAIALAYSGNSSVQPINWSFSNIYVSGNVSLYTPVPAESGVVLDKKGLAESYEVEQILNTEGKFETTITPNNLSLADLISNITENISVSDQHNRTDTLRNSWTFTSNSSVLRISASAEGVAGQGFAFSGEGSAELGVSCKGINAENTISFNVSAQGITKIEYDANGENSVNHDPTTNLDSAGADYSITSITTDEELASVQTITVTKYGMSGATFNLSKLVKFYVTPETVETEYTNISFKLSTTYFGSDVNLEDLFGENGMITLTGDKGEISDISESTLQTTNITSLKLNHNFGENHKITFLVTDESGAVNYTFVLNILNNTSVSAPSSISTGNDGGVLYANVPRGNINATITYDYHSSGNAFPTNLLTNGYIVPNGNEGNYIISQVSQEPDNAVGEIENDNVKFSHFFKETAKTFAIEFRPEGDNDYTVSHIINFKVTRNVDIDQTKYDIDAFEPDPLDSSNYFTIKQISDGTQISDIYINYYIGTSENNYLHADASGNLTNIHVAQDLIFDYGITSLTQKIVITVNSDSYVDTSTNSADVYQETLGINVVLPEGFWRDLAKDLTANDNSTPSWQFAGGTNKLSYLVFEDGEEYKIIAPDYGENSYAISISQRDGDNRLNYYTVINEVAEGVIKITYKAPNNDLLYGYGEGETVYTYMTLTQGEKTIVLRVPTIISQIGTKFVSYSQDENNNATFDENSLDLSKQSWSQLYSQGKFTSVAAGEGIDLNDYIYLPDANFNITTSQSFTVGGSAGANVQNAIGSLIYEWTGQGALTLNHLSSAIENAYLFIEYTISTASGTESFGYLFKVEPSVVLDEPNYPYGGAAEYITMSGSQTPFDLDETFNSTTVQNGHSRFEYTFDPEIEDAEDLLYTDQVVSVRVGTQTYTNPAQWSGYINAQISVDTTASSSTRDHSFLVLSSLNTAEVVEIVVRRSYAGEGYSDGEKDTGKSIVGGTIDYHFVLNDNRNYTIRVENKSNIQNGVTDYTWDINNWANDEDFNASTKNPREETRTFYLVENWQAGSATSGNIIENRLYFNLHNQTVTKNADSFEATSDGLPFTFAYSNSGPNNGKFTVTYPSYLSKDHTFSATLYTDHGALSEVTFVFHADANASLINDNSTFDGGQDVSINDIFTISTSGKTNPTITSVEIVSYGKDLSGFVNVGTQDGKITIQLASTVEDIVGDLTLTVFWEEGGEPRSFTFTISNFTIKANITQKASLVFGTEIGGKTDSLAVSELLTGTATNATISMQADTSNSAIASAPWNNTLDVTFKQVGKVTEVTMPVTVTVTSAFDTDVSTKITINVTFRIYPSVKILPIYPTPSDKPLKLEYIENGTTFANFEDDFLEGTAIFGTGARVEVEYAQLSTNGSSIEYVTTDPATPNSTEIRKQVIIKEITNAVVTDVTNSGEELRINDEIGLESTITFARGINSGTSQVVLSISYNNYVMDYTIQIVDTAFVLSLNQASNNISADSVGQYETLYVDKTESQNLLAENRMLKATLSSSARAGDYYIFFILNKDGAYIASDVLASKIINLSENFVNNSRNSTIYLDLGNNSLSNVVLGSESGEYTPVMISDSVYEKVLNQENDENKALVYIAENYNKQNATIKLTNYFDSTFTNASLSSRVTMTYGEHEVAYDKFSDLLSYYVPNTTGQETEKSFATDDLNIATSANIGTSTTAITKFSFGYRNGGAHWEEYTSNITATDPTYTYDNDTKSYTFTDTAGTEISIPTNALTSGEYHRVIYNNKYYYPTTINSEEKIVFEVVSGINTFKVEKFVEKRTPDVYSITKTFQVSYRYLADLDIEVGILADNGGVVELEANATIKLVEKFNVRRKTTREKIQMSDMVSGNANFILTTVGTTNEVGSAKYLSISAVRTDDERTTYDWVITGNGASNNGNDVSLSLKYKRGDFIKTFNLTVHVVDDYNITFDGSGDKSTEEENGQIIYSNQGNPYIVNTSSFETSAQILLAGESAVINGGAVASTPYMSITHRNASGQGERSVLDFTYTITANAASGDTTYNISGNINSKLNFGTGAGKNNWTPIRATETSTHSWTQDDDTSLIMTVNKVEFGSQFYRIKLVDKYGYTIYLYFTLDSGEEDPEIYTTAGDSSLSLTEGERVAFGAQYQELTVTANNGGEVTVGENKLTITAEWKTPSSAVSSIKMINIRNIDAWGFNQKYYSDGTGWGPGNVAYFGGSISLDKNTSGTIIGYGIDDTDKKTVGKFESNKYTFVLEDEKSQEYLKLPNFQYVKIYGITYYYNNGGSLIEVGTSSYASNARYLATDDNLSHAGNTPGGNNSIYKNADNVSLNLPTISQGQTWIYGNANQVALTMVVRLKYEEGSNTEYFDISQDITLSKTTQISEQNNLVADNVEFDLKNYINVTNGTADVSSYTIYDDTLAVAVKPNSRTTFDLVYGNKRVSYSLNNANYGWEKLYYISLSERFDTVFTNGEVTIIPKDENAKFYYGLDNPTGNNSLSPADETSFVKVANVDYFTVETYDNNNDWIEYKGSIPATGSAEYTYNPDVGGYPLTGKNVGETITITAANLSNLENCRISYNNTYYYPAKTVTIDDIANEIDRITISNKNDMSNGTVSVYQYYVIQAPDGDPYRYRANFTVSGTYQSVYAPNQLTTLPLSGSAPISQWANGAKYTQIGAGYELSFTVVAGTADTPVTSFTAKNKSNGNIASLTINGISKTSTNGQYTIDNAKVGDIVVVRCLQDFTITYNSQTISSGNSYRAIYVENNLSSYSNNNLYFVITSDNESGTGGTGLATIDATNGTIKLLEGFNEDHFVTVQIYQKVSGIDGRFSGTDVKQMHLLGELRVYPAPTRQISGGGQITLSQYLPKGTYYENTTHTVTIPAYTKADLVVKNDNTEVNRIAVENDSAEEKTQPYTLATLIGKTVYNYKPLDNGQDGLTLSIENAQVSKSGYSITMTQNGKTQNINLGEEFYLEARTGKRSITTSKDTDHVTISMAGQLVNTIKVDETWELSGQLKRKEFTLLELLDGKNPDDFSALYMDLDHFDANGAEMPTQTGAQYIWVWTAEDFAFDITLKSETSAWIVTHNDYVKSDGTNETLKLKQTAESQHYTYNDLHMYWSDPNNARDHDGDRLLTNSRRITFDYIEIVDFSAFQIDGTAYNGAVNITPTNGKTSDTIRFGNGNVTTKTYIILSGNIGNKTLTFRSISFKNQVSTTGEVELSDILTEGWYFSQNDIKVTIPAYTKSADLVVYSGDTVVSKLSVENKTGQAVTKTYSLEQLFSSANFSGEPNGDLTIKIENVCLTENCYSLEFVDSENNHVESIEMNKLIDLKKDDSSIIEIYLPSNAVTVVVKNSSFGQELNRLSVDELTYISTSEDGKLKTYQATLGKLLGQSNYQGAIIGFSYLDENGETINITEGELAGRATVARLTFGNEQKVKVNFIEESGTGLKLRISDTTNSNDAEIGDDNMLTMSDLIGSSSSDIYIGQNSCTFVFLDIIKPATGFKINELDYNIGTDYSLNNIFNDTITSPTEKIYYIVKTDGRVFECHVEFLLDS